MPVQVLLPIQMQVLKQYKGLTLYTCFVCIKQELRMTHMLGKRKPFNPYHEVAIPFFFSEIWPRQWRRMRRVTSFHPQLMHRLRCSAILFAICIKYLDYIYKSISVWNGGNDHFVFGFLEFAWN